MQFWAEAIVHSARYPQRDHEVAHLVVTGRRWIAKHTADIDVLAQDDAAGFEQGMHLAHPALRITDVTEQKAATDEIEARAWEWSLVNAAFMEGDVAQPEALRLP